MSPAGTCPFWKRRAKQDRKSWLWFHFEFSSDYLLFRPLHGISSARERLARFRTDLGRLIGRIKSLISVFGSAAERAVSIG